MLVLQRVLYTHFIALPIASGAQDWKTRQSHLWSLAGVPQADLHKLCAAIRDALEIYKKPIIELHISNIYKREEFRHKSLISDIATGGIFGLGDNGYILAIIAMQNILQK